MRFIIQYSILAGLLVSLSGCQRIKEVEPTYNESGTELASDPSYVVASMAPIVVTISSQPRPSWPIVPSMVSSPSPILIPTKVATARPSEQPTAIIEPTLTQLPTPTALVTTPTVTQQITPIGKPTSIPMPTMVPIETPVLEPTPPTQPTQSPVVIPTTEPTPIAQPTQPPEITPTSVPPQDPPEVPIIVPSSVPSPIPSKAPTVVPSPGFVNLLWTRPLQREDGTTLQESEISAYRLRYFDENGLVAVTDVPGTQTNVQIWAEKPYRYEIATMDTDGLLSDFVGPTTSPIAPAARNP